MTAREGVGLTGDQDKLGSDLMCSFRVIIVRACVTAWEGVGLTGGPSGQAE